jgi:aspartate racemase
MKGKSIIGVIGGMGPQASCELYRLMIAEARHRYGARGNDEYPEIVIDSVPVPDFLADTKKMEEVASILEDRVKRLTAYGVSTMTLACNTACILSERLQKKTDKRLLSVVDEVAGAVLGKSTKVLILASPTSIRLGLYQLSLSRYGISFVIPRRKDFGELEYIIRGVLGDEQRDGLTKKLVRLTERYLDHAIDGIVLGCTELPLVFPNPYRIPVYSSLSILAGVLVKRYYTKEVI